MIDVFVEEYRQVNQVLRVRRYLRSLCSELLDQDAGTVAGIHRGGGISAAYRSENKAGAGGDFDFILTLVSFTFIFNLLAGCLGPILGNLSEGILAIAGKNYKKRIYLAGS